LSSVLDFLFSDDRKSMLDANGEMMNYVPAKNLFIPVNKQEVIAAGVVQPSDTSKIVPRMEWRLNKNTLLKNDIMTLEILRSNLWNRPIYFAISVAPDAYLGLNNYFQQEGLTYRLVPYSINQDEGLPGGVQADIMYDNMMHKFAWGGVDKNDVYLDENILRMITNLRSNFGRLASVLLEQGKKDSAIQVLDKCMEVLPEENVPVSYLTLAIAKNYYDAGAPDKGRKLAERMLTVFSDQLKYYSSLDASNRKYFTGDINEGIYVLNTLNVITQKLREILLNKKSVEAFRRYVQMYTPPKQ